MGLSVDDVISGDEVVIVSSVGPFDIVGLADETGVCSEVEDTSCDTSCTVLIGSEVGEDSESRRKSGVVMGLDDGSP